MQLEMQRIIQDQERELATLYKKELQVKAKVERFHKIVIKARGSHQKTLLEAEEIATALRTKRQTIAALKQVPSAMSAPAALDRPPSRTVNEAYAQGFTPPSPLQPRKLTMSGEPIPPLPASVPNLPLNPYKKQKKHQPLIESSLFSAKKWDSEAIVAAAAAEDAMLLINTARAPVARKGGLKTEGLTAVDYSDAFANHNLASEDYDNVMLNAAIEASKIDKGLGEDV